MPPTGAQALQDPALHTEENGWATGMYHSGAIGLPELCRRLENDGNRVLARRQR